METAFEDGKVLSRKYMYGSKIGEGSYGLVHKAKCKETGQAVAIKKVRWQTLKTDDQVIEGISATALREVSILKQYKHDNIIRLRETYTNGAFMFLIFDYLEYDMKSYMQSRHYVENNTPKINKNFLYSLLQGIKFLHVHRIIHRDLKPANILFDKYGRVRIADLGLARTISHTSVVTLWYRSPEIILRSKTYGKPMDIWSLGCLYYEFVHGRPLFDGEIEIEHLFRIFEVVGTPTEEVLMRISANHFLIPKRPEFSKRKLENLCYKFDESELELVQMMLEFDPNTRITAKDALQHRALEFVNLRQRRTSLTETEAKNLPYPITSFIRRPRPKLLEKKVDDGQLTENFDKGIIASTESSRLKRSCQSTVNNQHKTNRIGTKTENGNNLEKVKPVKKPRAKK